MIVLPGGGYAAYAEHEAEPIATWLRGLGIEASVFRYPLNVRHPIPLDALRGEIPEDFAVLGYAITSMETETYRPSRLILLGEDATPEARRLTSLDALVTSQSPPFFVWHTAEDIYVPPEHTYRFAAALAANGVPQRPGGRQDLADAMTGAGQRAATITRAAWIGRS